jgi:dynein heavy chain
MQIIIKTLRSTLKDFALAIEGSIIMNDQLYNSMNALYDSRIPPHSPRILSPADTLKKWFDQVKLC